MRQTTEYAPQGSKRRAGASAAKRPPLPLDAPEGGEAAAEAREFTAYREDPAGFAREVLGSVWWRAQEEIAAMAATHRRVAVKAANGVGKTYLAADIVLWFLYSHRPSVVLTTAPTWRQVESLLWEEIKKRFHAVNARAEREAARPRLEGSLLQTRLKLADGHFAMGLSTDEPVRFQGFHAENLLVVLDEACGVPEEIWDAVEGICVGTNNRVLAISNPLAPTGRFFALFKSPRWKTCTISALAHPNVTGEAGALRIPGAVTREAVADRIADWCELLPEGGDPDPEAFAWEGRRYRPNGQFRARVLGEFPQAAEDSLIALAWIEAAMRAEAAGEEPARGSEAEESERSFFGGRALAADIARYGADETIIAIRHGAVVTRLLAYRGLNTMEVAGRIVQLAEAERAEIVTVDEVGLGAGVADRLEELGVAGLIPAHFGARPTAARDAEHFLNLRAQTYWNLRELLRQHRIRLPQDATLAGQLASLRYFYTSAGQIQIESKDDIRRRGLPSPDRADAIALLFSPLTVRGPLRAVSLVPASEREAEPVAPTRWSEMERW